MFRLFASDRSRRKLRARHGTLAFRGREFARRQSRRARHYRRTRDRRKSLQPNPKRIAQGLNEATLAYQAKDVPNEGYFIPPTIFTDVKPESTLACNEIFGPVLSVFKARDLDDAIQIANGTDYALTAGFFSRSPANIERAKAEIIAGNVYINRSCTGAVVGRHPFGGFKMSGGGTKAGGGDYLLNFLVPRVVTENIMRHGFAPNPRRCIARSLASRGTR